MKWEYVRADEFCISVRDGTHDTPKQTESGYKLVTGKHIKDGQIDPTDAYYISEQDYIAINERSLVEQWDVLMSMIGTVGEAAVVKNIPNYAIKNVALFKCGGSELKGRWINYYLHSPNAQGHMSGNQKGSSQQFLSLKQLRGMLVPITDELYMQRVIDVLSTYDNLIENNQKQIKLLEEAAQRLYKEWFVDLRFPGYETTPVVDGVPEGWEQQSLGRIASVLRRGISPKYDDNGKYFVISQKCIRRSIMDISEVRRESRDYSLELNLQDKDTVICSTGTGTLGRVGQVFGVYQNTTFDSHVTLVRTKEYQNFIYQSIKYQQEFLMGMGRGSTNQQELYRGVIEGLLILVPTQEILNKADNILSAIHDKITALNSQIGLLVEARDRLLPKLMSGEIEV